MTPGSPAWQVCRVGTGGGAQVAVVDGGRMAVIDEVSSMADLLARSRQEIEAIVEGAIAGAPSSAQDGAPPLLPVADAQEVWAAGVTYERSRDARIDEAEVPDVYTRVYEAERPELFLKATPERLVAPGLPGRLRADSTWDACEPELVAVINAGGEVVGYGIGDDISSRSIEGENPLYLPQAKIFDGACVLSPGWTPAWRWDDASPARIALRILRDGVEAWSGETTTASLRRRPQQLAEWLFRELSFPAGAFLLTGTGIVPPDDVELREGDVVQIEIEGLGTLEHGLTRHRAAARR